MATIKALAPTHFTTDYNVKATPGLYTKFIEFADKQSTNHTLWFFIVLMVHGVLILPMPAVLMYYFDAPAWVLGITMPVFFINIIANMAGGSTRTTISLFGTSVVLHIILLLMFII
ncbi:hypothetical protein DJ568_06005 [Mucilaginibacter hurinus]|uniref:Uncharacterized protein n=1 Tax=Mucilaginibacter hurinus TaxID=2201324 RepID=A0A367GRH5_9SPHI|nr:hypothetical protein [Mucilaginibacter hurinus]RCH55446.1 hypothetical protein DJ568_06005 [Mucilaginibacter hurinus]